MQFLFFALSVGFIFFIDYMTKAIGKTNLANFNKRFIGLLQFVKFAPIIALFVLLALVLTYFHTKEGIRLSHAWYVAQFWAYTAFIYCSFMITKSKICLIPIALSLVAAIYLTPIFHYEKLIIGRYVIVSDIFGALMFIALWVAASKTLNTMRMIDNGSPI